MEIDWMFLTYLIVGIFAAIGFFRGWWKEAFTILVLAMLMILLQRPDWAQVVIDFLNRVISTIWQFVVGLLPLTSPISPFQFDATSAGTWIAILILLLGISALIARLALPSTTKKIPGNFYAVGLTGRVLGVFLGALNGFLILSLLREYLDGRALPGRTPPETEIAVTGSSAFGPASTSLSIQAVNLPSATIMDSYIPWIIIGLGALIFFAALKGRVKVETSKAGRKVQGVSPYGYERIEIKPPEKEKPMKVEVTNK
jgi:hypothetical protein